MHRVAAALVIGAVLAPAADLAGQGPSVPDPPIWKLPIERRLAARFDLAKSEERRRRIEAEDGVFVTELGAVQADCGAQGRFNPELFLPWELFNRLIRLKYGRMDERSRLSFLTPIEDHLPALGFGDDFGESFWRRLGPGVREFVVDGYKEEAADADPRGRCARRAKLLAAARKEFGSEQFDRFLYEAVAPGTNVALPCTQEWREQLLYIERGCR